SHPSFTDDIEDEDEDTVHREMHQQVGDSESDTDSSSTHSCNPPPSHPPAPQMPPAPPPVSPPAPHQPSPPPVQPAEPVRRSMRSRVPAQTWQQSWFKAGYKPQDHLVPPQPAPPDPPAQQYRDPTPQIPSSDEEDDPEPEHQNSESESDESELLASECAYLTMPEALEVAYKASAHDDSPKSYAEAMAHPDAQNHHDAAVKEIQALLDNGTWELSSLPPGHKAIGCRWVFIIKRKSDGSIDRYRARLVGKGFSQRPGFDYDETYASTVKWATLRVILAYAALEDLEIESIAMFSAFLNGDIDSEIYMQQPEGFPQGSPDQVLRLVKSIYGMKQSPRLWHQKLDQVLT